MNTVKQINEAMSKEVFAYRPAGFNGPDFLYEAERFGNKYCVSRTSEDIEYSLEEVRNNLENNKWIIC